MSKMIVGLMLVDAPHSALNNAGKDAGGRTDNFVRVKSIRKGRKVYPYVSGQALRYWWRDTLEKKFGWVMSPIIRTSEIAFTSVNPIDFPDDDVFGYMRAIKGQSQKAKFSFLKDGSIIEEEITLKKKDNVTRSSPLKNSPLVSIVGQYPEKDWGVMARHEGDPVPFEHEFYSTILKGIFSLDLDSLGKFYSIERTGFRNMYERLINLAKERNLKNDGNVWILDKDIRENRVKDVLSALPYLYGGAKSTIHLTDITPKFIILAAIDGGNHIFMDVVHEENEEVKVDFENLEEVLHDYSDILKTDVYIGIRSGFFNEIQGELNKFCQEHENVKKGSINDVIKKFIEENIGGLIE